MSQELQYEYMTTETQQQHLYNIFIDCHQDPPRFHCNAILVPRLLT